jgi:uncharacterized protein (TIGR03437 family)
MRRSLLLFALTLPLSAQTVRFATVMGNIDVEMRPDVAPLTVANFLKYVNRGAYINSIFHRSVPHFVIQGGGYEFAGYQLQPLKAGASVRNEFNLSNIRGTIAMAKVADDPDSATSQWFFNLADNSAKLDHDNGGYTVFGRVVDDASMSVVDAIAALPICGSPRCSDPFTELPLRTYSGGTTSRDNLVVINSITILDPKPAIADRGVISAGSFGALTSAAAGSFLEIYGTNLAGTARAWASGDFNGDQAPTSLDGVTVTVGGIKAYISYVSPSQVNVQVPAGVPQGSAVPVVVTFKSQSTSGGQIAIRPTAPGLLASGSVAVAFHATGDAAGTLVKPESPAKPGEILTFYGIGFGPLTSGEVAGRIPSGLSQVATPVEFQFGGISAEVAYAGMSSYVGVYQFNVVVPPVAPSGDLALQVLVGGNAISQTLTVPVQQ